MQKSKNIPDPMKLQFAELFLPVEQPPFLVTERFLVLLKFVLHFDFGSPSQVELLHIFVVLRLLGNELIPLDFTELRTNLARFDQLLAQNLLPAPQPPSPLTPAPSSRALSYPPSSPAAPGKWPPVPLHP
jgi:hypothetical protein